MKKLSKFSWIIGVTGILVFAYLGVRYSAQAFLDQNDGVVKQITSLRGIICLLLFAGISILGVLAWVRTVFPEKNPVFVRPKVNPLYAISSIAVIYLLSVFVFVYTGAFRVLLFSWFTPFYFAGVIVIYQFFRYSENKIQLHALSMPDVLASLGMFILLKGLLELKLAVPPSPFWNVAFLVLLVGNGILSILLFSKGEYPAKLGQWVEKTIQFRQKNKYAGWLLAVIVFCIPAWWLYQKDVTGIGDGLFLRLEILLLVGYILAVCIENSTQKLIRLPAFTAGILLAGYGFMAASYLTQVTDFPMALGWSEGNRLYDYSLIFGKSLYQYSGALNPNYFSPGRYGLWGLPFLIPGLPIQVHRLWNAILYCVPGLILGWLFAREAKNTYWKIAITVGMQLFLNLGPIYPSLTIALIIATLFTRSKTGWRAAAILVASFYAGLSRFTWVLVLGAWAGLLDLFIHYPSRAGSWIKKLLPTAGFILLGILPVAAVSWPEVFKTQADVIQKQPLLWYRLFPNSTYHLGVLPGLLVAVGCILVYLIYLGITRRWEMDVWQALASAGVLAGFLASGLVASTKIGGGSNLHNMDMFLVSLALLFLIAMRRPSIKPGLPGGIRSAMDLIFIVGLVIPAWMALWGGGPLVLPDRQETLKTIDTVQKSATEYQTKGLVLFMDQRQLLTFGAVKGITLIPDYEKKYMMDQAMAGNQTYFAGFYKDLQAHKFSLIVSETQKLAYQSSSDDFNEENNAWVKWVSEPFLEYYEPIMTFKDYGFSLYVPKTQP
jgi:hypothetical protein